ncbi:MAG: hypothetical protein KJ798_10060 [Gammaproteobacteria bacterium]|uniref:hypothetical protein n=1 Tax=Limnobacter sp. TaxID=2003368 RepID=UPI001D3292E7|nr:hypothetical protein [Limnobacter sp.]MBU0783485.1 hypothetical protein [Gammaproteobacteria bacterium]MBU0850705.1 hypothetical protein [Gammaproteobacteria bacterium]MBU1267530.1 hypothetical protein [Gammaproteobacteria bacterium]MBU1527606.1 hypothetical protein [Gammaproteobacteria bacterium]MBU1780717.1 hypothetical protein [Gammaproteobacteria bacterium]
MPNSVIQLSVQADTNENVGELFAPISKATIEFFESFEPSPSGSMITFGSLDGVNSKELSAAQPSGLGELRCISQACVSDISVVESNASLAGIDPGLLANVESAGIMNNMNNQISFQALNAELLDAMPRVQNALSGQLGHEELSQLIADIQAQVLELNTLSQDLFGDLSGDVNEAAASAGDMDADALLASMQIDSGVFAEPLLASFGDSAAYSTTLDGLFTSPESFPLTMDFSSPTSVKEASDLFASTGSTSSISSTASSSDAEGGVVGSTPGSSDHS